MEHKTVLITGPTSGIGEQTAWALARQGFSLYLLVRDIAKGEQLKLQIVTETGNQYIFVTRCDLADMRSVADAAAQIRGKLDSIDVLINNAGGIFPKRQVSKDDLECTFATNHMGHFVLTLSLMPLLQKGHARIINVSSDAHKQARVNFNDLQLKRNYSPMRAYGNAKLFNIYFTRSLNERFASKGVTAYCLHPGVVNTHFGEGSTGLVKFLLRVARPFMKAPGQGAETTVYLATEPGIEKLSGNYFKKKAISYNATKALHNSSGRQKLWLKSVELAKGYLV